MKLYNRIYYTPFLIGVLLWMVSCGGSKAPDQVEEVFCISDTLMKKIKIAAAKKTEVNRVITLSGKITANEDKVVNVFPLVGGHVEDLRVELGDYVKKGQVLAMIRSSEIIEFQTQLISAQSNVIIAQKNLDVAEDMFKSGLNSEKEVIVARKEYQKAEGELNRIKEVLSIYEVESNAIYLVKAPISGFIVQKNISENMQFRMENTSHFFTISDLDEVWVMANVFESDIDKIKVGYNVQVKTIAYPDQIIVGKVDKIFNVLDPLSRVMKVRIKLSNTDYRLKPEMFAKIIIKHTDDTKLISVPSDAVIFDKNKNYLMVYHDRCKIETREIKVDSRVDDITYISEGIKEGDQVIYQYHLLVYDALND